MTHLSDFSFLQRAVGQTYVFLWFIHRIFTTDRFKCLHPSRIRHGDLKAIVSYLIFVMLPFQLYYDIISTKIKYEEGFMEIFGNIIAKPEVLWTQADKDLVTPSDYSLCVGLSLQIGTLLLLQCFWKYLADVVANARFMSSKEFKFYIIMTIVNIILFPVLQFNFSRDIYDYTYKEIMPQLAYGCEMMIISWLGVVSHFRFNKLLHKHQSGSNGPFITHKIRNFQDLNLLLSVTVFLFSFCLIIVSADGLTPKKVINTNKFYLDFLICNFNLMSVAIWIVAILIIHPKKDVQSQKVVYTHRTQTPQSSILSISGKDDEDLEKCPIATSR